MSDRGGSRPGDWDCPTCGNNVYASKSACSRCQTPKPGGASYGGGGGGGGYGGSGGGGGGGGGNFRPGDWICTTCGNNVYASKSACSRCQTPKPLGGGGGSAGGPGPGYGAPYGGRGGGGGGGGGPGYNSGAPPYGAPPAAAPAEPVAQCDDKCLENGCDNSRIYVTGLAPGVTSDDIHTLFSGIGIIARIKQKRGYKDQWPYAIKIYTNEAGKPKGDATVTYEDPAAAHSASSFFTGHLLKGQKLVVQMAGKSAARPAVPAPAFRGRPY